MKFCKYLLIIYFQCMYLYTYIVLPEHMVNFVHSENLTTELICNDTHYTHKK